MIFNLFLIIALILSGIELYRSSFKSLLAWSVLLISIVLVYPVLVKLLS